MWLGYVYLVKKRHDESLNCFRKALHLGQKGIDKWMVQHKYVSERIDELEDKIKERYKEILTLN